MSRKPSKLITAAVAAVACLLAPVVVAGPSQAVPDIGRDPAVISEWNAIAVRTIATENGTPVPASPLYFAFVSIAMHDAVATIEGGFEPFTELPRAHAHASPEVAAATAAHHVLKHYFPNSGANLDADYAAFLAEVPKGVGLVHGTRVGEDAAAAIIALRADDGRGDPHPFLAQPDIGVWRPTPDLLLPMAVSWLGFVDPLVIDSPTQFAPAGPDPVESDAYATDFTEVKEKGALNGSTRSDDESATALFWTANPVAQYNAVMRAETAQRGYDIGESARAFALLGTSMADTQITCWRSKFDEAYWRPITAIHEAGADGNDATMADPMWKAFRETPPYPDYTSGHACVTGSASEVFGHLFGADTIDIDVPSTVQGRPDRHFAATSDLDDEAMNARIWLGFHFRKAMTDGNALGHSVAGHVIDSAFVSTD
ncbi:hypothetical protein JOE59_002092 [Agromyces cerinus]|uniref:vanadium-dependent haloperoxidase n=1 Tax=Agromyces cerinus TaxID=33878 RepID=UPI00195CB85C|nr:vanadium-dependent haloperoxidase [Agromyces cerinus]MBM7831387.1 hypothetical protein [Agromyces cerinus]